MAMQYFHHSVKKYGRNNETNSTSYLQSSFGPFQLRQLLKFQLLMPQENIKTVQDFQVLNVKYSSNIYTVDSKSFDFKQYFYIKIQ